jgi:hypothetical protein
MERWYDRLGKPGIFRNDRFWLAGDHLVDPRVLDNPKIIPYVESSERAKRQFKMTDNQGMNVSSYYIILKPILAYLRLWLTLYRLIF